MLWLFYYAYKHPKAYNARSRYLFLLNFAIFGAIYTWFFSAIWHLKSILPSIPKDKTAEIQRLINEADRNEALTMIIFLVLNSYMVLLSCIHDILGIKEPEEPKKE